MGNYYYYFPKNRKDGSITQKCHVFSRQASTSSCYRGYVIVLVGDSGTFHNSNNFKLFTLILCYSTQCCLEIVQNYALLLVGI